MENRHLYLFYGSVISLTVLLLLFAVRLYKPELLDLDVKWLTVAAIPLVIGLVVGRFITKFSGFGLEIEVAKEALVDNPSVITLLTPVNAKTKATILELNNMLHNERERYNVLVFQKGYRDYYHPIAITEHVNKMPNIKYFEIVDSDGRFNSLIKINRQSYIEYANERYNSNFITDLEERRTDFGPDSTDKSVTGQETIIDTLKQIRESGRDFIAVVDNSENRRLLGVVHESVIEKYLADAVLKAASKKSAGKS